MEKVNFLVIDSTSSSLKIAIQIDDEVSFFEQTEKTMNHLERLIPLIDEGIKSIGKDKRALNCICVCEGPGSFTGIRVGIATALGIAFAGKSPCFGFSAFDVYDYLFRDRNEAVIIPIIDAKKHRFYTTFLHSGDSSLYDLSVEDIIEKSKEMNKKLIFVGPDYFMIHDTLIDYGIKSTNEYPQGFSAKEMLEAVTALFYQKKMAAPEPVYLRKSEAEIALEEKLLKL